MHPPAPLITSLPETLLIGKHLSMSLTNNRTGELWKSVRPHMASLPNRTSANLISLQCYPNDYFTSFNPSTVFEKWAGVVVTSPHSIPSGFELLTIPAGDYAVFAYKGSADDPGIFQYIFTKWLPQSNYSLDERPHFEVLGEKYKNNHPESEEDIWIPIKKRTHTNAVDRK